MIVQVAVTARPEGQLLVCLKSPLAEIEEILSERPPVLVRVTDCPPLAVPTSWLPKVNVLRESAAAEAPPTPERLNDGGVPGRLLFKVSVPLTDPCAVGVKVTFTVQLAATTRVEPQLLVWLKPALVVKPEMESVAFPLLVMVIVCAVEVVWTRWVPMLL